MDDKEDGGGEKEQKQKRRIKRRRRRRRRRRSRTIKTRTKTTMRSLFVGWLFNVPATCECISGTDLL